MICRNKKCKKEIPDESAFCLYCGMRQTPKKRTSHKRVAASGTITKLSGKRSKPYQALRAATTTEDGGIIRPLVGTYATYAEAEDALRLDKVEQTAPPASEYTDFTLSQIFDEWKKTRDYKDLAKQTQDNYNAAMKYLKPSHGQLFRELRRPQFQQAVDAAEEAGRSHSTMEKIKAISTILSDFACENDVIMKSYAKNVKLPAEEKKKSPEYFSDIEVAKLDKISGDPIVDMIMVMIYTGMRISEMTRLTKFDIDVKEMLITGGAKTDAGKDRIIPIHPRIQPIFASLRKECDKYIFEELVSVGNKKQGTDRLVKKPYRYEHFCDLYYEVLQRVGIRRLTPHKARHTFFTRLDAKCDDKLGMAMVGGHSDPNFTERTYVHPDVERLRKVIACL
jgi:integrase